MRFICFYVIILMTLTIYDDIDNPDIQYTTDYIIPSENLTEALLLLVLANPTVMFPVCDAIYPASKHHHARKLH